MKWFDKFKSKVKKELVGSNIPTYLDYDDNVVLTFPDGHKENGQVAILQMFHSGWAYVVKSETGEQHILTYMPDKAVEIPIQVEVWNKVTNTYYQIKEVEFNLHHQKEDVVDEA